MAKDDKIKPRSITKDGKHYTRDKDGDHGPYKSREDCERGRTRRETNKILK